MLASAYVPAWPARALVSLEPATSPHEPQPPFNRQPWLGDADNDWGMRDAPRTIDKPAGTVRTLFVGDSFVESRFTPLSLPAAVKQRLPAADRRVETIGLGVPGTDPRSYYYRIRDVGLKLSPDAILLFFYAGNDFMPPDQGYSIWPRLVDESPGASIVGWLMPRTNWLLVNRLNLSNFFQARAPAPPNEEMMIDAALKAPPDERLRTYRRPSQKVQLPSALRSADHRNPVTRRQSILARRHVERRRTGVPAGLGARHPDQLGVAGLRRREEPAGRSAAGRKRRGGGIALVARSGGSRGACPRRSPAGLSGARRFRRSRLRRILEAMAACLQLELHLRRAAVAAGCSARQDEDPVRRSARGPHGNSQHLPQA